MLANMVLHVAAGRTVGDALTGMELLNGLSAEMPGNWLPLRAIGVLVAAGQTARAGRLVPPPPVGGEPDPRDYERRAMRVRL